MNHTHHAYIIFFIILLVYILVYIFLVVILFLCLFFIHFYRRDEYEVTDNGLTQTITEKAQELMMEAMQTSGEKVKIKSSM